MINYFRNLFVETWTNTEKFSIENNSVFNKKFISALTLTIFIYLAFALSILKYYGNTDLLLPFFLDEKPGKFGTWFCYYFYGSDIGKFHQKIYWVSSIVLFYLLIPIIIIKYGFKKKLIDFGMSFTNIQKDYPLYILMLLIMLPIIFFASKTASFQERYPIFKPTLEPLFPLFILWQLAYFIQFIAVEFFFRGFILHGLKNRFGFYAVFISMIPYCMVHFGKPFGETIAAIFAGIVLGTLSLKSRSIILGILIHYSVAITMDIFALYRLGLIK
jgi:uncharacterized protein